MEWSWPESVSSNSKRVEEELVQGRELASQLSRVLDHKSSVPVMNGGDVIGSAEGLVNKIMGSFANTLLILKGKETDQYHQEEIISDNQFQVTSSTNFNTSMSGTCVLHSSSEHSKESCKTTSTFKDRRGSYKRRKSSHSWSRDSPTLTDDGHAWRKYGQKVILNEKHTRNYYRCTNKFDQACQATKHVQKIQDDPPVFRTTYYGNHSCRDYRKASDELVEDYCTSPRESSKLISFGNAHSTNKQEHPFFKSFASVKKELIIKEEMPTSLDDHVTTHDHHNPHSSRDYLVSDDLTAPFESSGPMSGFSSTIGQLLDDHEDVISAMIEEYSYHGFDDEILQFDQF